MNTTEKRLALVIGNSNYGTGDEVSGVENAKAMAECLEKQLGFTVNPPVFNANGETTCKEVTAFSEQIRDADVVLFFYSGHGVQLEGTNYLIPTDGSANPERAVRLDDILQKLSTAPGNAIKLVFLDACREIQDLPPNAPQGLTNPPPAPPNTLLAYAASPNQVAESGLPTERSVYTKALLNYLPVPGLEVEDLFARVRAEVFRFSDGQQTFEAGTLPQDFYFHPPVFVQAQTFGWPHSRVVAFHSGELVLSEDKPSVTDLRLDAEKENHLVLMVSNGKTHHNGQVWGRTESWSYKLDLRIPVKGVPEGRTVTFEDREDVPFKDGPHHGQTFIVGRVTLVVHPQTAEVTVKDLQTDVAQHKDETPFWAQDQEILFQAKLVDLQISPDDILGGVIDPNLFALFRPFLAQLLTTGRILDQMVVDPEKTYVAVRGNRELRSVAHHCMTVERANRLRDLGASFASFFNDRNPRPFDVWTDGLNASIRANAASFGITRPPEELRVWTSLDDLSAEAPAVEALAADAPGDFPKEQILALEQESILTRRPGEALIDNGTVEQVVQGVPLKAPVYTFLTLEPVGALVRLHARVVADLTDLQIKIGRLIDTIPLPTDNCARFAADNIIARIWGKELLIDGNTATLKLNGDAEMWACAKDVPCSKIEWNGLSPTLRFWDCRPPIKRRILSQSFEAKLQLRVEKVDDQSYTVKLGDLSIDLGGPLGGLSERILDLVGVDVNAKAKEALERAISPGTLQQKLPDFALKYNPTLVQAQFLSNAGALALQWDLDATLTILQLAELFQDLLKDRDRR